MTEHDKLREKLEKEVALFLSNGGTINKMDNSPYKFKEYYTNRSLIAWYNKHEHLSLKEVCKRLGVKELELKSYLKGLKKLNRPSVIGKLI